MDQLSFLPAEKQQEVEAILQTIIKVAKPEKVILFGSHANGTWVEHTYFEDGIRYSYYSDYDFLVVIKKGDKREEMLYSEITSRCLHYRNVVYPLVHDIDYVNQGLLVGQYFFTDIIREGKLLYDSGNYSFAEPKLLTEDELRERSREYYESWFPRGEGFLKVSKFCLSEGDLPLGIFLLHQAVECFYSAILLVHTGYKPKSHSLDFLRTYSKEISPQLRFLFLKPKPTEEERHLFDLLKKGYLDARYKKDFRISADELAALIGKVTKMRDLVAELCREKI